MESATRLYTRIHDAFADVGVQAKLAPHEVRILVAVADLGGSVRSDLIEAAVNDRSAGSHVRRALLGLYAAGYAEGTSSIGGGRRKRGTRTIVTLTPAGQQVAARVRAAFDDVVMRAA